MKETSRHKRRGKAEDGSEDRTENKQGRFRRPGFGKNFARLVVPLLDGGGNSVWPQRFDSVKVAEIRKSSGEMKFRTQMLLEAAAIDPPRLNVEAVKRYDEETEYREASRVPYLYLGGKNLVGASCWWDPSYGRNLSEKGDGSVIAAVFFDGDGIAYLHRLVWLNDADNEVGGDGGGDGGESRGVRQCRKAVDMIREMLIPEVRVETNGLGAFLPGLLKDELRRRRIHGEVTTAFSKGKKNNRILQGLEARLAAGSLYAHKSVWETPFFEEMSDFHPEETRARDDALDAVSQAINHPPTMPHRRVGNGGYAPKPWPISGDSKRATPPPHIATINPFRL